MTQRAEGTFKVDLSPQELSFKHKTELQTGRMHIDKRYEGGLEAQGQGEMLSVLNPEEKAGGYVAIEIIDGKLNGKQGRFALQHSGTMDAAGETLFLEVIPGSGEGQLKNLQGKMTLIRSSEGHSYTFDYTIS